MSLRSRKSRCFFAAVAACMTYAACATTSLAAEAGKEGKAELRVCADPDNLPYSHENQSGFENRIAQLVADDMDMQLRYYWLPLRRGFVRKTMGEGNCDLFIGVPVDFERVLTTRPYYRSTYVFVHRQDEPLTPSFDPQQLRNRRIGVQLVGNDLAATPPGHALTRAGMIDNVVGYTIYGDGPAAQRMVDALAEHRIDVALIWGPQAGYFAQRAKPPMKTELAQAPAGLPARFDYAIARGVRRGDTALRDKLNRVLDQRRQDIETILRDYAVPLLPLPAEDKQ